MKRVNKLFLILFLFAPVLFSCNRDKESEGISRITNYPTFVLTGGPFISVVQGGTFTDPGVKALEGSTEIPVTTTGSVDTNTPGVYEITYSAKNADNYSGTAVRTVAVIPAAENPGVDISGRYNNVGGNPANGSDALVNTVTKLAPGFYRASNVWGGGSLAVIPAYIFTSDGTTLQLPLSRISPYGRVQGTGTINATGLMELSVTLLDQGLSNSPRKWQKQ
ncbi:MAG TPA: DUF5011 domain-containing protein [Adhaeribacter sp.]|nr:DUF5011 domain-containing protein [Adhaeribacter sp.]